MKFNLYFIIQTIIISSTEDLKTITNHVYFDLNIGDEKGRIIIGLQGNTAPKTVENFIELSSCSKNLKTPSDIPICYKNTKFHNILEDFIAISGDIENGDGSGGYSIFGKTFPIENQSVGHFKKCVGMAHRGGQVNSIFQIAMTDDIQWMDGNNIVFGEVIQGQKYIELMQDYIVKFTPMDQPSTTRDIQIEDSGVYDGEVVPDQDGSGNSSNKDNKEDQIKLRESIDKEVQDKIEQNKSDEEKEQGDDETEHEHESQANVIEDHRSDL